MGIRISPTALEGVLIVEPQVHRDDRGFFLESYHRRQFSERGIPDPFVQDNHSRSAQGVLRGFHFQDLSAPMGKLIRCTSGEILDVAVDLRVGSPTFGHCAAVRLSAENFLQLWVPVGFGHAFLTLSASAEVQYKCTGFYEPGAEGAVRWDDPDIAFEWPVKEPVLSSRDRGAVSLQEYLRNPAFRWQEGD